MEGVQGGGVGVGLGVRVDVNEELKFLGKFKKKNFFGGGSAGGDWVGRGGGVSGRGGDGFWGQGGCE